MADTSPAMLPEPSPLPESTDGAVVSPTPRSARRSSWFGWPKRVSNGPQRPSSALSRVVEGKVAPPSGWTMPDSVTPSATASTTTSTTSSPSDERTSPFDTSPVTPVSPGNGLSLFGRSASFSTSKPASSNSRPSSSSGVDLSMSRTYSLPSSGNTPMLTPTSPPVRPSPSPLTRQLSLTELDKKAEQLILNALARSTSRDGAPAQSVSSSPTQPTYANSGAPLTPTTSNGGTSPAFSKKTGFGAYLGLGALSLTREKSKTGEERGRKDREEKEKEARARSSSPFRRFSFSANASEENGRRGRSPSPGALRYTQSDVESDAGEGGASLGPRRTAFKAKSRRGKKRVKKAIGLGESTSDAGEPTDDKEGVKVAGELEAATSVPETPTADVEGSPTRGGEDEDSESDSGDSADSWDSSDSWSNGDIQFDDQTELNTALNGAALKASEYESAQQDETLEFDSDPLGEGVNVVRPEEPVFQSTYMARPGSSHGASGGPSTGNGDGALSRTRKKSLRHETLELVTSRPHYATNRCMMSLTQGQPDEAGREGRRYVVASDLSEESRYAVEWGIGTVLRDGDEMIVVNVQETETKLDPTDATSGDRTQKIKNQQERQTLTYLLCRQVTGLLQRTKLNVRVYCMAIHSKNSRRMLLDLIDYTEPTMVIVGSRGLNALKGILLGSTSHYLIQKSSVPVMVARRRLKRPAKRTAHLEPHKRVSLAEAAIDKAGPGKAERDADATRDEIESEEASKD
ncbi:stress protein A family protein [Ceratobasidium sp. AG-Ba]|nr:stress protein A family protein [Ceratobasidium sp. AG-Ba]